MEWKYKFKIREGYSIRQRRTRAAKEERREEKKYIKRVKDKKVKVKMEQK